MPSCGRPSQAEVAGHATMGCCLLRSFDNSPNSDDEVLRQIAEDEGSLEHLLPASTFVQMYPGLGVRLLKVSHKSVDGPFASSIVFSALQ